jgi:hypothetical protein
MFSIKVINNKEYITCNEYILDPTINKWININDFLYDEHSCGPISTIVEFEKQFIEYETNKFIRSNEGF